MTEARHIPGLDGLDEVPWDGLEDVYGSAESVPDLLATAFTGDEREAHRALLDLDTNVYHQGGQICSAAPALLPFLLRLAAAADRPVAVRSHALELVAQLGSSGWCARPRFVDPGWPSAWQAVLPEVVALLDDAEASVRASAAAVLSWAVALADEMLPVLRRRWETEPDEVTRLSLVEAAAALTDRHPEAKARVAFGQGDVRWLLDLRDRGDVDTRMTIGFRSPLLLPDDPAGLAVAAVDGDVPRPPWLRSMYGDHIDDERALTGALGHRVAGALADRPDARADLARRLLGSRRAGARVGAVELIAGLVGEFRGAEEEWADTLGPLLAEPWSRRRTRAAQILSVAGEAAAPWADALAERAARVEDTAERRLPGKERAAALFALARLRDPRVVPLLLKRADQPCFGLSDTRSYGAGWLFSPALPDVLGLLAAEAEPFLPALTELLRGPKDGMLSALATAKEWGPAAAPLAEEVAALLEESDHPSRESAVLAEMGPAAARHAPLVRRFAGPESDGSAALAFWRLTGDAEGALELLEEVGPRRWTPFWTLLAEVGPAAAGHIDAVRGESEKGNPPAVLAYWRLTGDADAALSALLDGGYAPLGGGAHSWTGPAAVRVTEEMGAAAAPALPRLRELRADPRRPGANTSGWRDVVRDRELLALLDRAIARIGTG
ncbi:hypothetical protein [Nocardiopsis sp. CC223A]|uniref:hypothetical protein n=1 Tax=Nocardiopsis sp. CC223A TaxID=3044051 RepID=UPI00278C08D8|nr:hypothetical protein [Nocardiopsis sp. CC223A]